MAWRKVAFVAQSEPPSTAPASERKQMLAEAGRGRGEDNKQSPEPLRSPLPSPSRARPDPHLGQSVPLSLSGGEAPLPRVTWPSHGDSQHRHTSDSRQWASQSDGLSENSCDPGSHWVTLTKYSKPRQLVLLDWSSRLPQGPQATEPGGSVTVV